MTASLPLEEGVDEADAGLLIHEIDSVGGLGCDGLIDGFGGLSDDDLFILGEGK